MESKRMGRPTAGDARSATLRHLAKQIVDVDHKGNQAAASRALGFTKATMTKLLGGGGAGFKTADALVRYVRRSMDQILAVGGDLPALRGLDPPPPGPTVEDVTFGKLPNWSELREAAQEIEPRLPPWVFDALALADVWLAVPVTAILVHDCGRIVYRHVEPPVRSVV